MPKIIPVLSREDALKSKSGSIVENSVAIFLTRMSYSCSSFLILSFMAFKLGPYQVGMFSITMGLYGIFQVISLLGYDVIVIREIAKDKNKSNWLIQHGLALGILSTSISFILMLITGWLLNYSPVIMKSVSISSMALFPFFLNFLTENVFIAMKKSLFALYTALIREMTWLALSVWWLNTGKDYNAVIVAFIVSRVIGVGLMMFFLERERIHWWKNFNWFGLKELVALIQTFFFINLLGYVLSEIDVIILSKLVPIADVGFYRVSKGVFRVSVMVILSMITGLFPSIVDTIHKMQENIVPYFKVLTFRMFVVSIVIAASVFLFAHAIMTVFFGSRFAQSVTFIQILIWKTVPCCFVYLWSRFLVGANHQGKELLALKITLPLFLLMSISFVGRWGAIGMAYADVVAITVQALIVLYFVNRTVLKVRWVV